MKEMRPVLRLPAALFPMWLASALPPMRLFFSILAAAILLGVWPFHGRRRTSEEGAGLSLMMNGTPVILGAAILSAGLNTGLPSPIEIAFATALGLLSLVAGLVRAWGRSYEHLTGALSVGLAGLALVAAVWAGDAALLAAVRLAVFAPATLMIVASLAGDRSPVDSSPAAARSIGISPAAIGLVAVYLAVAGLPLTAGFGGNAFITYPREVMEAGFRHLVLGQSLDAISAGKGYVLLTDRIHLNSRAAGIVADAIADSLAPAGTDR